MRRTVIAVLFGLLSCTSACAQGPQCRTAPTGTESPNCASETFVTRSRGIPSVTIRQGAGVTLSGTCTGTGAIDCTVASTSASRITLAAATTFYISIAGTDQAGCGTATGAAACRTRSYVYNTLATLYDLGGQAVTVSLSAGTYTDSLQAQQPLLGQAGAGGLIFTGDCIAGHTSDVLIQPAPNLGYSYSAAFGAGYRIQCQAMDHTVQIRAGGANDMTVVGQDSKILYGNPALFGVRPDLTFGCNVNPFNHVTVQARGYVEFDNDFSINVGLCQVTTSGTVTNGSASISAVASTTNVVVFMGIIGAGIPSDAYVSAKTVNTITFSCIYTSPCQASATNAATTLTITGGGQTFMDMGNGAQSYFNTNGDPSYTITVTLSNYPFFHSGFFFINELSATNAQAITFVNSGQARGRCSAVKTLSNIDTGFQGIPYLPCNSSQPEASYSSTVTVGNTSFVVASAAGIALGQVATDVVSTTATWTTGQATMTVVDATGIVVGARATGAGINTGALVTAVSGTTISLGGCGVGPKCIGGFPYSSNQAGQSVIFSNGLFTGSSVVTSISGTTIGISDTIKASGTASNVWFQGRVTGFSVYD